MKIFVVGCSVVRGAHVEDPSWAEIIQQETNHKVDMVQANGMGNEYISHIVLQNIFLSFIPLVCSCTHTFKCYSILLCCFIH